MGPERKPPVLLPKEAKLEVAEGTECSTQTLYEGDKRCQCCKNWVVDYPEDLRVAVEDQLETKQKALVVRMSKNHDSDGGKPLVLHSVVVQSSSLKKTLGEVFEGFKGITPTLKKLVFRSPFRPFHHRWDRFTDILERQKRDDPDTAAYTQLLYDILDAEIRETRTEVADYLANRVIVYNLLWALFEPGVVVFSASQGLPRFYVVESREYDPKHNSFTVMAKFVDWDGSRFGYSTETLRIDGFVGTRGITELPLYPAEFHPSHEEVKENAIARGRKFQDLAGIHYRAHSGTITYNSERDNGTMERYTSGRIVIDTTGYMQGGYPEDRDHHRSRRTMILTPLHADAAAPRLRVTDDQHNNDPMPRMFDPYPIMPGHPGHPRVPSRHYEAYQPSSAEVNDYALLNPTLTDFHLLLCPPTIRGYSLKLKLWGLFSLADITPIAFNDTAFPNLMLPPTYKDMILSFVEAHPSSASHPDADTSPTSPTPDPTHPAERATGPTPKFDDLIEGKGLGIILLLVGNPGTGKTLTAEAVADKVRRPLYMLSAGELGQSARDVECKLRDALELAERWDAVLLFDECDVFLQERSGGGGAWDLARNEIVGVFLRLLEYYRGILFLTTNRGDTLDRAFHSRIHLTLRYPDLDGDAKEHIWRHFTTLSGVCDDFSPEVYERLGRLPMNGRQIKNTVKIATLLATRQKVTLGLDHVRTALQATEATSGVDLTV